MDSYAPQSWGAYRALPVGQRDELGLAGHVAERLRRSSRALAASMRSRELATKFHQMMRGAVELRAAEQHDASPASRALDARRVAGVEHRHVRCLGSGAPSIVDARPRRRRPRAPRARRAPRASRRRRARPRRRACREQRRRRRARAERVAGDDARSRAPSPSMRGSVGRGMVRERRRGVLVRRAAARPRSAGRERARRASRVVGRCARNARCRGRRSSS